jgi:hypothetical protein
VLTAFAHPGLAEPRTKEEWRTYLSNTPPTRPSLPSLAQYRRLSTQDREALDDARLDHHSALVIVRTEQMKRLHHNMHRRMRTNARQAPGARRGIVLDGPPQSANPPWSRSSPPTSNTGSAVSILNASPRR